MRPYGLSAYAMLEKLNNVTTRSIIDGLIVAVAFFLAYQIRYDGNVPPFHIYQFWVLFFPLALGRLAGSALPPNGRKNRRAPRCPPNAPGRGGHARRHRRERDGPEQGYACCGLRG